MTLLGEDKITEMFGTPEEMAVRLDHYERDVLFLWNNMSKWRELYLDQWIAIYGGKVIAVAQDMSSIVTEVREVGIPLGEVVLQPIRTTYSNIVPSSFRGSLSD
jgi:hypothetical protein